MNTISCPELNLMKNDEILDIRQISETENTVFFKIFFTDGNSVMMDPIKKGSSDHIFVVNRITSLRNNRAINTKKGKIKVYKIDKRKKKVSKTKKRLIAVGLATVIGLGTAAYMTKNDITIKDVLDHTIGTTIDKLDEARLKGSITDEELHYYYHANRDDPGANSFFEYEKSIGEQVGHSRTK